MKIYVVSDTHLNHKMALAKGWILEKQIESFFKKRKDILKNVLIHLGDVCLGDDIVAHKLVTGGFTRCVLVRGNHDNHSISWYLDNGWSFVCDKFSINMFGYDIVFSHVPMRNNKINQINVCGHMHFDRLSITNKICLPPLQIFGLDFLIEKYNKIQR